MKRFFTLALVLALALVARALAGRLLRGLRGKREGGR